MQFVQIGFQGFQGIKANSYLSFFLQVQDAILDYTRVIHLRPDVSDYHMARVRKGRHLTEMRVLCVQAVLHTITVIHWENLQKKRGRKNKQQQQQQQQQHYISLEACLHKPSHKSFFTLVFVRASLHVRARVIIFSFAQLFACVYVCACMLMRVRAYVFVCFRVCVTTRRQKTSLGFYFSVLSPLYQTKAVEGGLSSGF